MKYALAFIVAFGLAWLLMTDCNTAFCNTSQTGVDFVLCRLDLAHMRIN